MWLHLQIPICNIVFNIKSILIQITCGFDVLAVHPFCSFPFIESNIRLKPLLKAFSSMYASVQNVLSSHCRGEGTLVLPDDVFSVCRAS